MTTILIARPEAEGRQTAARLQAKGFETILTPALNVVQVNAVMPDGDFQAVLVTSGHAVPWLSAQKGLPKSVPVFAVGDRTGEVMRGAGFTDVRSASGDRVALAALVRGAVAKGAALLVPVGRDHHGDMPEGLRAEGYKVATPVVYAANIAEALSPEAQAALRYDVADAVLHYSARSAAGFTALLTRSEIDPAGLRLRHICLSQQVADALPAAVRDRAVIAERADEEAMLQAVESVFAAEAGGSEARSHKARKSRARAFAIDGKAVALEDEKPAHKYDADKGTGSRGDTDGSMVTHSSVSGTAKKAESTSSDQAAMVTPPASADVQSESLLPRPAAGEKPEMSSTRTMAEGAVKPEPASPPRRMGLPLLGAGLFGGLVGGAAALFVPHYLPADWLPGMKTPDIAAQVSAQVKSDLDARATSLPSRADVEALKQAVASEAAQRAQAVSAVQNAVTDMSRKLADVEKLARSAPDQAAAAQKQVIELAKRMDLLDGVAKVPYDIVGLSKRVDDLAARRPEAGPDLAPLDKQLTSANAAIADLRAKLDALAAKPVPDTGRPVRIHALATGIMGALQRGDPYKAELDAVMAAGVPAATIQPLQPYADKGAPGAAVLAKAFETAAPKVLQALEPPAAPNPGVWDKMKAMASGIVRVRPVGQSAGETPAGQVARIESALPRGAFADALKAWQALPQAGQAAAVDFGVALKSRADADAAARAFVDEATRAHARQGQ